MPSKAAGALLCDGTLLDLEIIERRIYSEDLCGLIRAVRLGGGNSGFRSNVERFGLTVQDLQQGVGGWTVFDDIFYSRPCTISYVKASAMDDG
jgi:hypothetical protein